MSTHGLWSAGIERAIQGEGYKIEGTLHADADSGVVVLLCNDSKGEAIVIKAYEQDSPDMRDRLSEVVRISRDAQSKTYGEYVMKYREIYIPGIPAVGMEVGSSSFEFAVRRDNISTNERLQGLEDAAKGLHVFYELGIVHRDFKPNNLIKVAPLWKTSDFEYGKFSPRVTATRAGHWLFWAPIVYRDSEDTGVYSFFTDVYAHTASALFALANPEFERWRRAGEAGSLAIKRKLTEKDVMGFPWANGVPKGIKQVCAKTLVFESLEEDRFQSADEWLEAFAKARKGAVIVLSNSGAKNAAQRDLGRLETLVEQAFQQPFTPKQKVREIRELYEQKIKPQTTDASISGDSSLIDAIRRAEREFERLKERDMEALCAEAERLGKEKDEKPPSLEIYEQFFNSVSELLDTWLYWGYGGDRPYEEIDKMSTLIQKRVKKSYQAKCNQIKASGA